MVLMLTLQGNQKSNEPTIVYHRYLFDSIYQCFVLLTRPTSPSSSSSSLIHSHYVKLAQLYKGWLWGGSLREWTSNTTLQIPVLKSLHHLYCLPLYLFMLRQL